MPFGYGPFLTLPSSPGGRGLGSPTDPGTTGTSGGTDASTGTSPQRPWTGKTNTLDAGTDGVLWDRSRNSDGRAVITTRTRASRGHRPITTQSSTTARRRGTHWGRSPFPPSRQINSRYRFLIWWLAPGNSRYLRSLWPSESKETSRGHSLSVCPVFRTQCHHPATYKRCPFCR